MEENTTQPNPGSEQIVAPSQPPSKPVKSNFLNSKWLKIGIVVMVLVVLLGGAYTLGKNNTKTLQTPPPNKPRQVTSTPTSDPTADWKTYENKYQSYSINYPSEWIPLQSESLARFFPPGVTIKNGLGPSDPNTAYISIYSSSFNPRDCKGDCPLYENPTPIKVGSINATMYKGTEGQIATMCACDYEKVIIQKGNTYYELGLYGKAGTPPDFNAPPILEENKKIFDQMLSTFKFTNTQSQNVTPTTSETKLTTETVTYVLNTNWQTYADNPAAYELRFPPGYERGSSSEVGKNLYILNCTGGNCSSGYSVAIYNDYNGGSRRTWFNSKHPDSLVNPYYENLVVQGVNGLLIMDGNTSGSTGSFVVVPRGSKVYEFSFPTGWNPQTGEKSGLPFIKEVLSTFKFL